MFGGKAYRSVSVILVLAGVLYMFLSAGLDNGVSVGEYVMIQPIPTVESQKKITPLRLQQSSFESENKVVVTHSVDGNIDQIHLKTARTENDKHEKDNFLDTVNNEDEVKRNASVKVNKIIKIQRKQPVESNSRKDNHDNNSDSNVLSNRKIVIIIAYMRTGSTLTASLLQEYPGTFYVFEPIRTVNSKFKDAQKSNRTFTTLHYAHGKQRNYTDSQKMQVNIDEINSWFTCKLDLLSKESLNDDFHKYYTKIMKRFYICNVGPMSHSQNSKMLRLNSRIQPRLRQYYNRANTLDTCLKMAMNDCQKSPLSVIKFIRLRMKEVEELLPLYPNMKIIHLVRDPRGILNSRLKVKAIKSSIYQNNVKELCSALSNDLKYSKRILQRYSDRLKIVHYEDMAENPMKTAQTLAEFAGIEFTKHMQVYIRTQTRAIRDACAYCTQRRNSNSTAHKWRTQLDPNYAQYIYDSCEISNHALGYLPFTSADVMRDIGVSSRKNIDVQKELLSNENF